VYDLFYRNYDPVLGRMNQVDPMASKYASWSPYTYSFNSPINWNDPSGADPWDDFWNIVNTLWNEAPEDGGAGWSSGGGFTGAFSGLEGFYTGVDNMDMFGTWGQGGNAASFGAAANAYAAATGGPTPLRGTTITYNPNDGFRGEPYSNTAWLQGRIDEVYGMQQLGRDFIYDNNNGIGLGLEIFENGTTEAIEEVLKNKALYSSATKIGTKAVGGSVIGLNLGVTFYTIGKELQSSDPKAFNTHSFVNIGVTVLTTGATAIGIVFAGATAPVWVPVVAIGGAAVGIGYGIAQVAGIDQWIDSRYGFK
jgi:hypothetical protein